MKILIKGIATVGLALFVLADSAPVMAQTSAAEMLEQARARAREMEELKAVLNGPDQNMRLASFDVMVGSGDEAMRQIAIDTGLASTDPLMQGMALKEAVLGLDRIVMTLEIDPGQPETGKTKAQAYMNSNGNTYTLQITARDRKTGVFKMKTNTGQVTGTMITFKNGHDEGSLRLVDETTLKGDVKLYKGGLGTFNATAKIR